MPSNRPWILREANLQQTREYKYDVAILPVGATEPHGRHLPYGNDGLHSTILSERCAEYAWKKGARAVVLPGIPYGVDSNLMGFPMAMHVRQSTLNTLIEDLLEAVAANGIHKMVILNGHGGNEFKHLLRDFYGRKEIFVSLVNWWTTIQDVARAAGCLPGDHADDLETSVALYLYPELVDGAQAGDGAQREFAIDAFKQGWVALTRPFHLATKDCAVGDSRQASAEKGEKIVKAVEERIGTYLIDLAKADLSEPFPFC